MKWKRFGSVILFLAGFVILFLAVQNVLQYHWTWSEDLYTQNVHYEELPEDSLDILFLGTSEMHNDVVSPTLYDEIGVRAYNLATSWKSGITSYYQLVYALKHQKPKLVVCDFSSLYTYKEGNKHSLYKKIADTMPDLKVKYDYIKDLYKNGLIEKEEILGMFFPLLADHDSWQTMEKLDLKGAHQTASNIPYYFLGSLPVKQDYGGEPSETVEEANFTAVQEGTFSHLDGYYYGLMINLCYEQGIPVAALFLPKPETAYEVNSVRPELYQWLTERGVSIIDLCTWEEYNRMDLDLQTDYFDFGHCNVNGAEKVTRRIAELISGPVYGLENRKGLDEYWNTASEQFKTEYLEK